MTLSVLVCCYAFQSISVGVRAVAARVLNQTNSFFPDDFFEVPGRVVRFVDTEVAFQIDRGFPLTLLMLALRIQKWIRCVGRNGKQNSDDYWDLSPAIHARNISKVAIDSARLNFLICQS